MIKVKKSYGVAVCRIKDDLQILLCRRRITYEFIEFVLGKYKLDNLDKVKKLLNGMINSEKLDLLSGNFPMVWYRLCLECPSDEKKYNICLHKYQKTYPILEHLINNSTNGALLWEIPKGRSSWNESAIETAIRETEEEIGITSDKYKMLFDLKPFFYSLIDYSIDYHMNFYIASWRGEDFMWKFKHTHNMEIDDVRWWTHEELNMIAKHNSIGSNNTTYINNVIFPILKIYKKYTKNVKCDVD